MILWQVNVWDSCLPTVTAVLFSLVTEITLLKFERLQFSSKHSTVIQPTSLRVSIYICVGPAYQWPILKTEMQDSPELIIRTEKQRWISLSKAVSLVAWWYPVNPRLLTEIKTTAAVIVFTPLPPAGLPLKPSSDPSVLSHWTTWKFCNIPNHVLFSQKNQCQGFKKWCKNHWEFCFLWKTWRKSCTSRWCSSSTRLPMVGFLVAQWVKNPPCNVEDPGVWSWVTKIPWEGKGTHSRILPGRIPWAI